MTVNSNIKRFLYHLLYWVGFFLALFSFTGYTAININFLSIDLPITIFYSYFTAYILIPYFFSKSQYFYFLLVLFALSLILSYIRLSNYNYLYYSIYTKDLENAATKISFPLLILNAKDFSFGLLIFLAVKFTKNWITAEKDQLDFDKEKRESEFRLLKSQIDPHFLFNTLNNLYSLSVVDPQRTSGIIRKFWGIMDFLVGESHANEIPIEKELKLISDYVELERIRYSDRLYFELNVTGDISHIVIPPLVFFPLVENCFKHGSSNDPGQPWIKLYLEEIKDGLRFTAANSVYNGKGIHDKKNNPAVSKEIQERLKNLLPGKHRLKVEQMKGMYFVKLDVYLK